MKNPDRLERLITAQERIEFPSEPWPLPKVGDIVRGLVRYNIDPAQTIYDDAEGLRRLHVDCVVWHVEPGAYGGCDFVYFAPIEQQEIPYTHSTFPNMPNHVQTWGGVDVVNWGEWPDEYIPIEAVKRLAFLAAVEEMKDHLDRSAAWR